ncbi:MAG: FAD:protein FMN transferase [Rudaea sp.]
MNSIRRARLWLGTLVDIRIDGMDVPASSRAMEAAFAEIACVHRLMSFHESGSDLERLRLAPAGNVVRVNARTCEVLECCLRIAAASAGAFDPTVAGTQSLRGALPVPASAFVPDARASWRDIDLLDGERVRLRKPLWVDLGGIAKGYAVDRAIEVLRAHGVTQACVNAGGDLRVCGPRGEPVAVCTATGAVFPTLELADAALATSSATGGQHVHGVSREPIGDGRTVSVAAARCMVADALTKIVLVDEQAACTVLDLFEAQAWVHDSRRGWQTLRLAA